MNVALAVKDVNEASTFYYERNPPSHTLIYFSRSAKRTTLPDVLSSHIQ
jgi:hypothetical protein